MKNFFLGILAALAVACGIYVFYNFRAQKFGSLQVTIASFGKPIGNLEVDIKRGNRPGQPDYSGLTDENGTISFFNVPAGQYTIYFNQIGFPENLDYANIPLFFAVVKEGGTTLQHIDIPPKP